MIHQCILIFHDKSLFSFSDPQINNSYQLQQKQNLSLSIKRTTLVFLEGDHEICHISIKHVQSNPYKHGETQIILYDIPNQSSIHKKALLTIKASAKCLEYISDATGKNKAFKSCLAFVPSQVKHISILSGESNEQRYRGFMNLIGIMFIILNIRNIIDNFKRYGVHFHQDPGDFIPLHTVIATIVLLIFPVSAYFIEKTLISKLLPWSLCRALAYLNIGFILLFNICYCRLFQVPAFTGVFFTSACMVIFLKLISFHQVAIELCKIIERLKLNNAHEVEQKQIHEEQKPSKKKKKHQKTVKLEEKTTKKEINEYMFAHYEISAYNLNLIQKYSGHWDQIISLTKTMEFIFLPTLCYQLQYPRTQKIRVVWLIKRIVQVILVSALQILLWVQYIEPELQNMYQKLIVEKDDIDLLIIVNQHLRLAVPNTIMWIAGFYNAFHLMMNISAEIFRFADRKFYMDWWNCRTLEEYWKTWNLPVHFWFIRHVYNPLLQKGYSKASANFVVFFISAVAHEYVISVPLKLLTYWGFLAMMSQAPTIFIQKKFGKFLNIANSELGNVSFWISFCFVGQPIVVFIYYTLYIQNLTTTGSFFDNFSLPI